MVILGGSIGDYLAQHGKMDESSALNILQQVLSGLEFMHRRRIIHGDIKGNIKLYSHCIFKNGNVFNVNLFTVLYIPLTS